MIIGDALCSKGSLEMMDLTQTPGVLERVINACLSHMCSCTLHSSIHPSVLHFTHSFIHSFCKHLKNYVYVSHPVKIKNKTFSLKEEKQRDNKY